MMQAIAKENTSFLPSAPDRTIISPENDQKSIIPQNLPYVLHFRSQIPLTSSDYAVIRVKYLMHYPINFISGNMLVSRLLLE